jgi:hypothetical protein
MAAPAIVHGVQHTAPSHNMQDCFGNSRHWCTKGDVLVNQFNHDSHGPCMECTTCLPVARQSHCARHVSRLRFRFRFVVCAAMKRCSSAGRVVWRLMSSEHLALVGSSARETCGRLT